MSNNRNPEPGQPLVYQIRIKGHLGPQWAGWFDGLTITREDDGLTLLSGPVIDQAALHGLLRKVRDLGLPLVSVAVQEGMEMDNASAVVQDTKRIFWECGACSHTFFYILNREFGYPNAVEERASNPLAGGLMNGHQCGMLWGSALAVGAEAFRRYEDCAQATAAAITATQCLMESFSDRAKSVNCRDVVGCDLSNKLGLVLLVLKTLLRGGLKNSVCFNLAEAWAPEAIRSATEGLSREQTDFVQPPLSCASEVARKMGASAEEMVTVAGLAGGMGLSGNACGALGAAIWLKTLASCRKNPDESPTYSKNETTARLFKAFKAATGAEFRCDKITGRHFETVAEHTAFIRNGGCDRLIDRLATESM